MGYFNCLSGRAGYVKRALVSSLTLGSLTLYSALGCCPSNNLPLVPNEIPIVGEGEGEGENTLIDVIHEIIDGQIPDPNPPVDPLPPEVPLDPTDPTPTCQSPSLLLEERIDFYSAMLQANDFASNFSSLLNGLSFDPAVADANGPYDHANDTVMPNGIPDIQEFYLISIVLNNPGLDLTPYGGIDYTTTLNSWNRNVIQMASDLGEAARTLVKGSETVFPGYITLGDPDSVYIPTRIADLAVKHMSFLGVKPIDLNNYTLLEKYFSVNGDADGDGTSNIAEYTLSVQTGADYASLALDPCKP